MNKVYRVIWSHVTNTFIAVSELATSKGKVKSFSAISSNPQSELNSSIPATFKLSAIALVSILAFAPSQVLAQDVNATNLTVSGTSTFTGKAKFGEVEATSLNVNGQAVATANDVTTAVVGKVDQGEFNTLKNTVDGKVNQGEFNTLKSTVDGKVNQGEFNTLKSTVDGKVNQGEFNTLKNTVDSKASKTELTNLSNLVAQLGLTAGGEYTGLKYFRTKSNLADATATGTDAIAIGPESKATSANTIAMGHSASATKQKSVAIGFHANTKSEQSIALGEAAKAEKNADKGIAIGSDARVGSKENGDVTYDGASSYVVGSGDGKSSIAIGDNAVSRGTANIAIGKSAINSNKDLDGQFSNNSIAVGTDAQTIASNNAIALGNMAKVNKSSDSSIAIGDQAQTLAINALALGKTSQAKGESSVAVGLNAQSESERTIAIGTNSKAQQGDVIALGTGANALPSKTISIGLNAGLNQVTDVAETKHSHINIGENAGEGVNGQFNIGIGKDAGKYVIGKANIAIGLNAGTHLANTEETVGDNVSIGNFANKYDVKTPIQRSTAIGAHTKTASDSTALGYQAQATALKSTAIGFASKALGEQAVAIGSSAEADSNNVALGSNSKAKAKAGTGYLTGTDSSLVVSVGHQEGSSNQHILRRLVNVADGADDQDAVTVSQLKKVTEKVTTDLQAKFNALNHSPTASEIKYDTVPPDAATGAENKITLKPKTRISNVANAESDTDAVNLKQVNQIINDKKAHYFSVNDQGLSSVPGNHDNDAATGKLSMAIGQNVIAKAERSIAIGNNANAHGEGSIALGTLYQGSDELDDGNAKNSATNATVSNQPYKYGLAIGAGANTEGNNSIAIGSLAASSNKDIQGGNVDRAIAIGYFARTSGEKSTAIGERSVASGVRANAMGSQAQATAESSTAIGTKANANAKNSIAFGTHQKVTGVNSGSIGYAGEEGDAPELKKVKTIVSGTGTYSLGNTNGTVTANESGIFGNNNIISAKENTRLVGNKNVIGDITVEPSASNPGGVAPKNELKDIYVTGYSNKISSNKKLAKDLSGLFVYGHTNTIADIADPDSTEEIEITNSSVIGANNTLNTKGSDFFVLGNNVNATLGNSVYLGKESAYVGAGNSTSGMEVYTDIAGGLNQSGHSFAGGTPVGVVTVGAVGKERRVQNVASGLVSETSTDAINGSQLFALTRPLRFAGDNSTLTNQDGKPTNDANVVSRSSNQAIDITGGETDTNKLTAKTDKNIGVIVTDNNSMEIRLAKTLTNLAEANFGTGNDKTTINKDGVTIFNNGKGNVSLTDAGLDNGNNKIVNVAEGTADTDAVNVKQLKDLKAEGFGLVAEDGQDVKQALGTAIKVTGDDNVKTKIVTDTDGSKKLEIGLENQVTLGGLAKNGNPAADGKLTLKNQAGTDKVVLDGANGSVGLTGADGAQATITVKNGSPAVDGTANTTKPRITYGNEEVATLNDGLKFGANDGTVHNAKLNTQVDVKGKAENTQWTDFDAGQNIMTQIKDNTITVALAKALSGLTSATFGDPAGNPKDGAVINKDGLTITQGDNTVSLTENGLDNGNKQIKNVASGLTKADGTATDLANAVGTNGVNVNDLKNVVNGNDDQGAPNTTGGFGLKDKAGQIFKQNLGETAQITGDSNVNTKVVDGQNGGKALEVSLANQLTLGKGPEGANAGEAGKITLKDDKGTDRVVVDGSEGAISLTGQPATQGGTAPTAKIKVGMGNADLESSPNDSTVPAKNKTRITYDITGPNGTTTEELATLNDGLKFGANTGDVHNAKLNSRVDVKGHANNTTWADFDAGQNIMTQIQGNTITVALAKALKDLTSASFVGGTDNTSSVLNGNGLTITKKADAQDPNAKDTVVSLTEKGLDNGGNQIVNVASGLKNKDGDAVALKDATGDVLNNGVNVGDLKDAITNITSAANGGFGLKDKDGAEFKQDLGTTAQITGDDNINTKVVDGKNGGKALEVSLADNITLGKPTEGGVEGKDASITVTGKDGASVVLNGKDGTIGLTGPRGADGKSVSTDIGVKEGAAGVDGTDGANGTSKTRIVYTLKDKDGNPIKDANGQPITEEVATLNDGMKFEGNDGTVVTRKLNETLGIKGGIDATTVNDNSKVSSGNLGVRAVKDDQGNPTGSLEVVMKERPEFSGIVLNGKDGQDASIKFTDKDGNESLSMTTTKDKDGNATLNLVNPTADKFVKITGVADGDISPTSKDAVNGSQLHAVKETAELAASGWNISVNENANNNVSNVKPKHTVDLNNTDGNIVISKTVDNDKHNVTFDLANKVVIGPKDGANQPQEGAVVISGKEGADGKGSISIAGKDGKDAVAISGKDGVGTIGLTGPAGADGKNANAIIGVKDSVKGLDGNDGKDGNSKTRIVYTKPNGEEEQVATMNDGLVFGADKGTEHKAKLGTTVKVKGDDKNIETEVAGDTIRVRLKDNIDVKGINVTENLTVKEGAKINMGNNVIDGVADGEVSATSKQAVNGSQLHKVQQQVNNQATAINKLGDHINKVDKDLRAGIAGATAVAFLQRPNEAGKSIVSLGVGSYRSESAIAVGYARNSDNNKISIKLGGGMNSRGDVNFGGSIGYQW
ncbi:TPA: YadA-like family protein [Pasteurella multocida]|nr:YadA-like family protein [Pasteurella multocida]